MRRFGTKQLAVIGLAHLVRDTGRCPTRLSKRQSSSCQLVVSRAPRSVRQYSPHLVLYHPRVQRRTRRSSRLRRPDCASNGQQTRASRPAYKTVPPDSVCILQNSRISALLLGSVAFQEEEEKMMMKKQQQKQKQKHNIAEAQAEARSS